MDDITISESLADGSLGKSLTTSSLDSLEMTRTLLTDTVSRALDTEARVCVKGISPSWGVHTICIQNPKDPSSTILGTEEEIYERLFRDLSIEKMFEKWYPSLTYTEDNVSALPKMIIADSIGTAISVLLIKWWNSYTWSEPGLTTLENAATLYKQFKIVSMITLSQKLNKTLPEKEADIILKKFEGYLQTGNITEENINKKKKRKW